MAQAIKLSELTSRKRRVEETNNSEEESDINISSTDSEKEDEEAENGTKKEDDGEEIVNIDFDFFSGNPNVDFHALKNLMRQLFGAQESNRIQLSALADLILESPTTTIKTDGQESDPYCFLSFINYKENRKCDYVQYLKKIDNRLSTFFDTIDGNNNKTCALVMSERLINMPPEVVPPLYKITLEDVSNSLGDGKHYDFYIIVSRKYEVNFDMEEDDGESGSRSKKRVKQNEIDYFHEEDRFFEKHSKIHFQSEAKKGVIASYIMIDHEGLVKSIDEFEKEIASW